MARYTDNEVLNFIMQSAKLDRTTIEREIAMMNKSKYLEEHKYSIFQGKDGKWFTTVPCNDLKSGRRLIKRNTRDALEDAIVEHYEHPQDRSNTFESVFRKWIDYKFEMGEICKGTYDRYTQDYTRYVKGTDFEKKHIKTITEDDIEDIIRQVIIGKELKSKAFANFRTLIMGTFKYAKRKKLTQISITPFCADLDLSKRMFRNDSNMVRDKSEVYTENEVKILMDWLIAHPHPLNLGIALDFLSGLRSGELAAMKFSDLSGNELHVQRQQIRYTDEKGNYIYEIVDYTKTIDGDRYVILPQKAIAIIRQLRLLNPWSEYAFPDFNKQQFNKYLVKACRECKIEYRSMHKIRKTYGTTLIDKGVEDSLIMSQMGHKDIRTTRSYYYFANKDKAHRIEQIENAVNF